MNPWNVTPYWWLEPVVGRGYQGGRAPSAPLTGGILAASPPSKARSLRSRGSRCPGKQVPADWPPGPETLPRGLVDFLPRDGPPVRATSGWVLYSIEDERLIVYVVKVGHRKRVYRGNPS